MHRSHKNKNGYSAEDIYQAGNLDASKKLCIFIWWLIDKGFNTNKSQSL
jgi:hypothetical protein